MRIIRKGTFETNSSSTHAIVVPKVVKEENYSLYDSLDHNFSFGREECRLVDSWDEKLAYAYLVIKDYYSSKEKIAQFKEMVNKVFNDFNKEIDITPQDIFKYIDSGKNDGNITGNDGFVVICERWGNYVDQANSIDEDFSTRLLEDYEFLKRYLFNKESYITVGGDEYRGYNIKTIGFEYDYEDEWVNDELQGEFWSKLEEYKKNNDVYLKGN